MKVIDLVNKFDFEVVNLAEPDREIEAGYCGDLLSLVMSKAPTNSVWCTVMNNVNVAAVAALADISVVIVCEVKEIDKTLLERAKEKSINILRSDKDVYSVAVSLGV